MTEEQLKAIELRIPDWVDEGPQDDLRALVAEVRRLRGYLGKMADPNVQPGMGADYALAARAILAGEEPDL
jgi:hypothetical protein